MIDEKLFNTVVEILDDDKPDWYKKVDLNKLTDLMQPRTCIIGQVYGEGSYNTETERLLGPIFIQHEENASINSLYYPFTENKCLPRWHKLIKERQCQ